MSNGLRKHSDLIQEIGVEARESLSPGCWVVVASPELDRPLALGLVASGPAYSHVDGHALDEVWELTDHSTHAVGLLTRIDLDEVVGSGAALAHVVRASGPCPDSDLEALRVHRAACLARDLLARGQARTGVPSLAWSTLVALIETDDRVAGAEIAWRDFRRVSLPMLLKNLHDVGALWLASQPGWSPGDATSPHPRWRRSERK